MAAATTASSVGSSRPSIYAVSEEKTNGTRLTRLLVDGGTRVLREVLHSIYPHDKLQIVLSKNRRKLQSLVTYDTQREKLFPSSGDPPDSDTFDISLLHLLIREICHLTAPLTGWHKMPANDDDSVEANIARIKCFRNELCHSTSTGVSNEEFEEKWEQLSSCLEALELYAYRQKIERLKSDPIDHDIERRVEEQVHHWEQFDNELILLETERESIKVPSCLPDELSEELMFGRLQDIQQVTEAIQSGSVSVVWITGGPGFGKTTVASKAAHELNRLERERAILFCSLRCTKRFHDAAILMTLTCSKKQTHLPEKPKQWLLNWSKQQVSKVTFILDNADDVLEYDDTNDFLNLLEEMKRFSENKVTFIITPRKAYTTVIPESTKNVRLACLPVEEAKKVLLSRVPDQENRKKLSKVDKLAKLCGFVPLALRIAGSSLSAHYNEDEFIRGLEEEPSEVLQDNRRSTDQSSVEKSISRSFEVLDELEQKALVLLCVFPGSFNSDAAKSLITAGCTTSAKSVKVLQELKDRSLVEQLKPCRYQVYQLIQTFVQKIGSEKYPGLLDRGKELACAHFISRFTDNAKQYWGKDTCKEAVDSFSEHRHNFEYFFTQGVELNKQTFVSNLLQNCMYLEKCVLPDVYVKMLEGFLNLIDSSSQPKPFVELLCLLGHEYRKSRNKIYYQQRMERAEEIYTKNRQEFKKDPVSEVYYFNSNARFLSENRQNEQLRQELDYSLDICNLSDELRFHPEKAATLLYAGVFAKRRRKFQEAKKKLEEALDLFKKCLGKHLMTAECVKNIADLYLELHQRNIQLSDNEDLTGEEKCELKKSHKHYEKALSMMKELGVDDHKETVLTL